MMEYAGYRAVVTYDDDAGLFHGEIVDTRDVITFQGTSVPDLRQAFRESVDEYLKVCAERGRTPDKPFSGNVALRLPPSVHRDATAAARSADQSLNAWLTDTIRRAAQTS